MSGAGRSVDADAQRISKEDARARLLGREIRVPASSANLGPGFDALAVALQLYMTLRVTDVGDGADDALRFDMGGVALTGDNYIDRAFRRLAQHERVSWPALSISVSSEIPMRGGLGSSAAATVAGLRLFERVAGERPDRDLLTWATELDDHADNVSAALLGGLTLSCVAEDGRVIARSIHWPDDVRFVVAMPETQVATPDARRVLPGRYSQDDAVFNMQRALLLVHAIEHRDFAVLREALRDRWHQPYRSSLVPGLDQLLALDHPSLLGVCLSGSGPAVIGLATGHFDEIELLMSGVFQRLGVPCRMRTLAAHQPGVLS